MRTAFILGNPRSGTSLLRLMLNAHPGIAAPPECGFLQWWAAKYRSWGPPEAQNRQAVEAFVVDLLSSRKMETWQLDRDGVVAHILDRQPGTYGDLALAVYEHWALRQGKPSGVVVDKNNYYIRHLETLHAVWPEAGYIHMVRDGRDVACSYREVNRTPSASPYKPVLSDEIGSIAREWQDNNRSIAGFLDRCQPRRLLVRYEDLVQDAEKILARVAGFLGVAYDDAMGRYFERNDEPEATLDWKQKTRKAPDASGIGRHRELLSADEAAEFSRVAGPTLELYGYGR